MMRLRILAAILLFASFAAAQQSQQRRIVRPVDNASTVRLAGTIQPRIRNATDHGPVSDTLPLQRMTMLFSPSPQQQAELDQLLAEQQDPNSPNYHKWLTPEEFADRFGLAQSDIAVVSAWLTSQGFTIDEVARGRNWIAFSGIAAQVSAAFRAPIHSYVVEGKNHFAPSTDISVPDAFSGIVSGVTGLHDFAPSPRIVKANPRVTSSITGNHFIVPGDFATLYNLPSYTNGVPCTSPCLDGTGQSIAIVGQTDLSTDTNPGRNGTPGVNGQQYDLVTFRNLAGLPPVNLQIVVNGSDPGLQTSDVDEANLDVEWSGGAAPNAKLIYVITSALQNGQGAFGSLVYAVNNNLAPIISVSYGLCENPQFLDTNTYNLLNQAGIQANAEGQAIVAASGDSGAADCDSNLPATNGLSVDIPGSMPYSTSIGGTSFSGDTTNAADPTQSTQYWAGSTNDVAPSAFSYIPETAWNDTTGLTTGTISATGGGASIKYPKPSWQTGPGVPADGARDVPDISINASPSHDETVICSQSSCVNNYRNTDTTYDVIGGTSIGAPTFAGMLALINQAKGSAQGNINPQLYFLVQSYPLPGDSNTSWAFNDITTGNNIVACTVGTNGCNAGTLGYSAGPGYDLATGLGSVDATALIHALTNSPNPHFLVLPALRYQSIPSGSSAVVGLSITPKEGFSGTVSLTCAPSSTLVGAACSFDNSSVSTPGSANLTIQTASGQGEQSGTVTVTGTSGSTTDSVVISINPPDFTIAAAGTTETVNPGGSTTDTITVTPLQGLTGPVSFICTGTTGITCSLAINPVMITSTSAITSTLTVNASSGAATGSLNIVATSGILIHSLPIPVTVNTVAPDFSLTVASPVVSISSGSVITDSLTVASVGGFSSDVALTCSVPSSLGTTTCTIIPSTVAGASGTAVVTLTGAVLSRERGAPLPFQHRGLGAYATFVFALGIVFTSKPKRGYPTQASFAWVGLVSLRKVLLGLLLLCVMFGALSCGGGGSGGGSGPTPLTGNVTITGTGGGTTHTVTINVTVT